MRWKYVVPFLVILGLLITGILTLDMWLKKGFIAAGERAFDAKVEIEKVHLGYFPLSLQVTGFQAANESSPMRNLFEVDQIKFVLNTNAALQKKWIIETIQIVGISLDTPRQTSGTIKLPPKKAKSKLAIELEATMESQLSQFKTLIPELKLPKTEDLQVSKAFAKSQKDFDATQKKWQDTLSGKAFETELAQLNAQIEAFKTIKIELKSPADVAKLQKIVQDTQTTLKTLNALNEKIAQQQKRADQDLKRLQAWPSEMKKASQEDIKATLSPFSKDKFKNLNFSTAAFSAPIQARVLPILTKIKTVMAFKKRFASPMPPTLRGRDPGETILFEEPRYYPKFWIKQILITGNGKNNERISGEIRHITTQQSLVGFPMTVQLQGKNLFKTTSSVALTVSHFGSENTAAFEVSTVPLSLFSSQLKAGELSGSTKITVKNGILASQTKVEAEHFKLPSLQSQDLSSQLLNQVLNQITVLNLDIHLFGPYKELKVEVNSNIEEALAQAFSKTIQSQIDQQKDQLKKQLDQVTQEATVKVQTQIDQQKAVLNTWFEGQKTQLTQLQKNLDTEKSRLEALSKGYQNEANEKVKAAQKETEAKANKEIDAAKKKAVDAAGKAFKGFSF